MIPENQKKLIADAASFIRQRHIEGLSVVVLESIFPVRRILGACVSVLEPVLTIAIARDKLNLFQDALAGDEGIRLLIRELESGQ